MLSLIALSSLSRIHSDVRLYPAAVAAFFHACHTSSGTLIVRFLAAFFPMSGRPIRGVAVFLDVVFMP